MEEENTVSRRGFMKGALAIGGAMAGGALLSGCASSDATDSIKWDKEADVVVIGYGGAGVSAAISASDAGANVLVIEKNEKGGGSTCVSGGGFIVSDDTDACNKYVQAILDDSLTVEDPAVVKTYTDATGTIVDYLGEILPDQEFTKYGGAGYTALEGADKVYKYNIVTDKDEDAAGKLFDCLSAAADDRGIEVLYNTPATHLIKDSEGQIIGVRAEQDGNEICIKGKRGVILTLGGFAFNEDMLNNYVKGGPIYGMGNPGNTGDGILMCQEVGTSLHHMNAVSGGYGYKAEDVPMAYVNVGPGLYPSMIYVDKDGKRFANEIGIEAHAGIHVVDHFESLPVPRYPQVPMYAIFDETARSAGPICMYRSHCPKPWSTDNMTEIEAGWIKKGSTPEELAANTGLDPEALASTISGWNADVASGTDAEFGRPMTAKTAVSLNNPPYYALQLNPAILNTQGGPVRDVNAQILDPFGDPIPHLFSAGEFGSLWGIIYQGGGNVGEALTFGRIAGQSAAAQAAWDAK